MAQTGYTPILIYSSSTPTNAPAVGNLTNSTLGSELAINIADGKLFYKDNVNAIQVIGWKTTPATAGGTGQTSYAVGDILYANTTTTLAKLADVATGNALISGGVSTAPSWGKIGLTTHVSGTLGVTNGGTGLSSATTGDLLYASGTNTWASLADVATGNALISGGVGVAPSWGKVGLTTHVTGTLPVGNGGTGLTTLTANYIPYGNGTSALQSSASLQFDGTNFKIGSKTMPTVTGGQAQLINDCLIFSGDATIGSPYTQNLQIEITWGNWGSNPAIGLVEVAIAAREFGGTAGGAFGWLYALNGGGAAFNSFVTTGVTAVNGTLTAASGGNYVLRITFNPTSDTDVIGYTIRIPTMRGGTASTVSSIVASLV
jgi:hypothetical protein